MAYRKVDERLWGSFTFRALSEDGRALYQYLLTTPQNNPLCCYLMPVEYASYHLQWTPQRVQKAMEKLVKARRPDGSPMVIRDETTNLTMVYGQLEKEGIINGNVAKACEKVLSRLPTGSPIYIEVIKACESLNKPFLKSLIKSLRERLPESLPELQEQEQEQEQDIVSSSLRSEDTLCSAPQNGPEPEPVLFSVPLTKRDGEYEITQAFIDEFIDAFPGIDVLTELKKLRLWNVNNSRNRKTRRGFRDHVLFWLGRAQNRAPRRPDTPAHAAQGRALDW